MPLVFFEEVKVLTPVGVEQTQRTPVAVVNLPENQTDVLFLFFPNPDYPNSKLKYLVKWIDIRRESIPPSNLLIYNSMNVNLNLFLRRDRNDNFSTDILLGRGISQSHLCIT
jgi:hypothetical protein